MALRTKVEKLENDTSSLSTTVSHLSEMVVKANKETDRYRARLSNVTCRNEFEHADRLNIEFDEQPFDLRARCRVLEREIQILKGEETGPDDYDSSGACSD